MVAYKKNGETLPSSVDIHCTKFVSMICDTFQNKNFKV